MFLKHLLAASLCAFPAFATTVTFSEVLNSSFTDSLTYTLQTTGNGSINSGQTGFSGNPATGSFTLTYSNYMAGLPSGSTITSAFLDFEAIFGTPSIAASPNGPTFFTPTFLIGNSTYSVSIAAAGVPTQNINGSLTATGYDLFLNGFASAISAGAPLSVAFSVVDVFTANTSAYTPSNATKNKTEAFTVTATRTVTGANNHLTLDYSAATTATPEPGSVILLGGGLTAITLLARRRKK